MISLSDLEENLKMTLTKMTKMPVDSRKEETLDPINVPVTVRFLLGAHDPESASNLCVALSGALGPPMSRRLRRALQAINPMNLDWA